MDNLVYTELVEKRIDQLRILRKRGQTLAEGIIGHSLMKEDLFFCAADDRALRLIDGFICMLRDRNLTCAGALLRLQMDNCMRTYAAFTARDRNAVVDSIIAGTPINRQYSKDGKRMSDKYLKELITTTFDPCFEDVYNQASGYIHLSEKAFYTTVVKCEDYNIEFQVGLALPERRNPILLEAADAFTHFLKLHFKMLEAVAESKKRVDSQE